MANEDWRELDIDSDITTEAREAYLEAKRIYRQYKEAKDAFEAIMQAAMAKHMPAGAELKFGYNFGKLSVAIGPKREAKAKKAKDAGSLSDWLAGQGREGRRV